MRRLKNNVSWPEVMSKTGLSAGRVLAVFEGLVAGMDNQTIACKYEIKRDLVDAVAAFFVEDEVCSSADEKHPEDAAAPRVLKRLRKANDAARKQRRGKKQ